MPLTADESKSACLAALRGLREGNPASMRQWLYELLASEKTGDETFLAWYERVWRICLDYFVNWEHGEWRQKLARDFTPMVATVALAVKDPFHLPRSLLLQIELLDRIAVR